MPIRQFIKAATARLNRLIIIISAFVMECRMDFLIPCCKSYPNSFIPSLVTENNPRLELLFSITVMKGLFLYPLFFLIESSLQGIETEF